MASEVEFFTVDSMIKDYYVYKMFCQVLVKCCTIAKMKEVKKDLSGRHPVVAKPPQMYTL